MSQETLLIESSFFAQIVVNLFNYPFWLFWVAIIGNMLFAFLIQEDERNRLEPLEEALGNL